MASKVKEKAEEAEFFRFFFSVLTFFHFLTLKSNLFFIPHVKMPKLKNVEPIERRLATCRRLIEVFDDQRVPKRNKR